MLARIVLETCVGADEFSHFVGDYFLLGEIKFVISCEAKLENWRFLCNDLILLIVSLKE